MECLKNVFAIIGLFATCLAIYYFAIDQIAIYKLNQKYKNENNVWYTNSNKRNNWINT